MRIGQVGGLGLALVACSSGGSAAPSASMVTSAAPVASVEAVVSTALTQIEGGALYSCIERSTKLEPDAAAKWIAEARGKADTAPSARAKALRPAFVAQSCAARFPEKKPIAICETTKDGVTKRGVYYADVSIGLTTAKGCKADGGTWTSLSTTVLDGFEALRARACARDVAGFYKLIDQRSVIAQIAKTLGTTETLARAGWNEANEDWTKDIDRGERGFICAWEPTAVLPASAFTSSKPLGDLVEAKLVSGDTARLWFERRGETWLLVAYEVKPSKK